MNETANKILVELLNRAVSGIDAAVQFSQAQIPDVIHQLLLWNFVKSAIMFTGAIITIPFVVWFVFKQCKRVRDGVLSDEGYSWDRGKPKYVETLVWDKKGEINPSVIIFVIGLLGYATVAFAGIADLTWLKIWIAPKLYLLEYAKDLVK